MPREGSKAAKGGDFDSQTLDDMKGMVTKWVSIPYGIIVVLVAGSAVNLVPYFLDLKEQLGFTPVQQELIRWGVLFGYYGGILAGPIVDGLGTTISFVVAALIAGGGFIGLAFYTDAAKVTTFNVVIIISLVLLVAFNCAIATIAAIATVIKNFSRNVGTMVTAVMIAYYFLAPWFDTTIRHGYFEGIDLKTNMIATGIIQFVVFVLAAFIVDENEQSQRLKRASSVTDRLGVTIYAAIAGGFIALIYFTCIIAENYKVGVFLMALFILINFIALGFTIQALLGQINRSDTAHVGEERVPPRKSWHEMLRDVRYYCLLFGTFIVIGSGGTYYIEATSVANAMGKPDLGEKVNKAYWLSHAVATLGGGLIASLFVRVINGWLFAAAAAFSGMVGFGLVFLATNGDFWFYLSAFFVGAAVGGWWVIVPQIIVDDAGPKSFEFLWGLTLTVNCAGLFWFERFFYWINEKTEPSTPGDCKGTSCYAAPYIVSAGLCLVAGILAIVGFANDEGTGGSGGEKKPLRTSDKNASDRRKSKDKTATGKREKSSGKREKSSGKREKSSGKRDTSEAKKARSKSKDKK